MKTHVHKNTNPKWNVQWPLTLEQDVNLLKVEVFDKDFLTSDDLVGELDVDLNQVVDKGPLDSWFDLMSGFNPKKPKEPRKPVGQIRLMLEVVTLNGVRLSDMKK